MKSKHSTFKIRKKMTLSLVKSRGSLIKRLMILKKKKETYVKPSVFKKTSMKTSKKISDTMTG